MTDQQYERRLQLQLDAQVAVVEWTSANSAAGEAESRLSQLWSEFEGGQCAPPSVELLFEVNRLRAWANYRLVEAMLHLRALARPQE